MDNKEDMSKECGFEDREMWYKFHIEKSITEQEFNEYWDNNCGKCKYMCEICMHGE